MKKWWLSSAIIISFCFPALSQENTTEDSLPTMVETPNKHHIMPYMGISNLSSNLSNESGVSYGATYFYTIDSKWSAYFDIGQGLNTGFEVLNTEISVGGAFAWKGFFQTAKKKVQRNGEQMADIQPLPTDIWVIHAGLKQNYFNGSITILPLSGPSFGVSRRFSSSKDYNLVVGGQLDYTLNGENNLLLIKAYAGLLFPL